MHPIYADAKMRYKQKIRAAYMAARKQSPYSLQGADASVPVMAGRRAALRRPDLS